MQGLPHEMRIGIGVLGFMLKGAVYPILKAADKKRSKASGTKALGRPDRTVCRLAEGREEFLLLSFRALRVVDSVRCKGRSAGCVCRQNALGPAPSPVHCNGGWHSHRACRLSARLFMECVPHDCGAHLASALPQCTEPYAQS